MFFELFDGVSEGFQESTKADPVPWEPPYVNITPYCRVRMNNLAEQYVTKGGSGDVFESGYLTYLELFEVSQGRNGNLVWTGWLDYITSVAGGKTPLNRFLGLSSEARECLVKHLTDFAARLQPPVKKAFSLPVEKVAEPTAPPADSSTMDEFDLFFGDN